ncbi:hypothetical protein SAMN05428985_106299 [Nocardioides sp. YR527]|uniref:hypothetical protein n=1 Tax=Nocardioides sp. YR527 TaxID=1881028 RepID=UPI000880CB84|nr:hypothetical protein [Nocardioides sp. YR527]SDK83686.1 hypothetical protein SAMN05428985_106299 [Nocardioides sp. YR527]
MGLLKIRGHIDLMSSPRAIRETSTARLVCETDNPYDANAVGVEINGHKVAYMSRDNAARFRQAYGVIIAEMPVEVYVPAKRVDGKCIVSLWPVTD